LPRLARWREPPGLFAQWAKSQGPPGMPSAGGRVEDRNGHGIGRAGKHVA